MKGPFNAYVCEVEGQSSSPVQCPVQRIDTAHAFPKKTNTFQYLHLSSSGVSSKDRCVPSAIKERCLPQKALFLLDNAPTHPDPATVIGSEGDNKNSLSSS